MAPQRATAPLEDDRFQVTEIDGYAIAAHGERSTYGWSFSVIDTCADNRELGRFYAYPGKNRRTRISSYELRRAAYTFARALNRAEREHEAQFDDNVFA